MKKSSKIFVGMDVHKESIDMTVAEVGGEVRRWGQIGGDRRALEKAVRKLESQGGKLHFVYEAGPCGFWIQRLIAARGHECWVVSPSLIPCQGRKDRLRPVTLPHTRPEVEHSPLSFRPERQRGAAAAGEPS